MYSDLLDKIKRVLYVYVFFVTVFNGMCQVSSVQIVLKPTFISLITAKKLVTFVTEVGHRAKNKTFFN